MYLYILEILEQRLPKACTAISSSALLIYPRAISSLNLVQNHTLHGQPIMSCNKDTHCSLFFFWKKLKVLILSIRDMRLILEQVTWNWPMISIICAWLTNKKCRCVSNWIIEIGTCMQKDTSNLSWTYIIKQVDTGAVKIRIRWLED